MYCKTCVQYITLQRIVTARSHIHIQITQRAGVVYSFELRMIVQLQNGTARTNHRAGTTIDQGAHPRYLILMDRVGVPILGDRVSCRGRCSESRKDALSFSLRTLLIDSSTR